VAAEDELPGAEDAVGDGRVDIMVRVKGLDKFLESLRNARNIVLPAELKKWLPDATDFFHSSRLWFHQTRCNWQVQVPNSGTDYEKGILCGSSNPIQALVKGLGTIWIRDVE